MELGKLLREWRTDAGMTQHELAIQAQVSLPTIQNLERNLGNPTLDLLTRIGRCLGFSFLPQENSIDWESLASHGLAISQDKNAVTTVKSLHRLHVELISAFRQFKNLKEREREALESLIIAIRLYFPNLYKQYFSKSLVHLYYPKKITGRHIKLSRISKAKLAEYL